ncbi:hypothetical protein ABIA32_005918 [Streptacidiphilus sp. MAP12-20]|uniref:hypothetical protein n=1 Tax=Streptacidiphilus sp. MAP12-20 TaxID=3156299 RepID=UPI003511AD4B
MSQGKDEATKDEAKPAGETRKSKRELKHFATSRWRVSCATRSAWMINAARMAVVDRGGSFQSDWSLVEGSDTKLRILYGGVVENAEKSSRAAQENGLQFWLYPGYADAAISNMHAADSALVALLPDAMFRGELPRIRETIEDYLPADDARRKFVESYGLPPDPQEIPAAARHQIESALRGAYVAHGFTRGRLRTFNNILLVASFVLLALTVLLALLDANWPSDLTCAKVTAKQMVCPLGPSRNRSDIFIVELIGAAGAAVAAIVSLSRSQRVVDPYMVHAAQAILKVSLGGVTAILGLLLLLATPGVHLDSQWQILGYAAIFGYSQQIFTRLIDTKGDELQRAASPTAKQEPSPDN